MNGGKVIKYSALHRVKTAGYCMEKNVLSFHPNKYWILLSRRKKTKLYTVWRRRRLSLEVEIALHVLKRPVFWQKLLIHSFVCGLLRNAVSPRIVDDFHGFSWPLFYIYFMYYNLLYRELGPSWGWSGRVFSSKSRGGSFEEGGGGVSKSKIRMPGGLRTVSNQPLA